MLQTTDAIVLALQPYSDKASILRAYVRTGGCVSYMVYGAHSQRGTKKGILSVLSPLNLIELTADAKATQQLPTLKECHLKYVPIATTDIARQCVRMFVAELLLKTLRLPLSDERIFNYLCDLVQEIDTTENLHELPQQAMQHISELLGYGGVMLDEWRSLKSIEVLQTIFG